MSGIKAALAAVAFFALVGGLIWFDQTVMQRKPDDSAALQRDQLINAWLQGCSTERVPDDMTATCSCISSTEQVRCQRDLYVLKQVSVEWLPPLILRSPQNAINASEFDGDGK